MKNDLEILYEDNHLIVVIKKPNILSQSDITNDLDMLTIIKKYLKEKYQKKGNVYLGLVHRLDRPTGGIMVFAKTSKAAKRLSQQIKNKTFKKSYLAVVYNLKEKNGTFSDYLRKNSNNSSEVTTKKYGKYAELNYKLLEVKDNLSLVKINLITGRHHQIRVQFSKRGYPLYGDKRYNKDETHNSLALYAYKLEFTHPTTKEKLTFVNYPNYGIFKKFNIEGELYEE